MTLAKDMYAEHPLSKNYCSSLYYEQFRRCSADTGSARHASETHGRFWVEDVMWGGRSFLGRMCSDMEMYRLKVPRRSAYF